MVLTNCHSDLLSLHVITVNFPSNVSRWTGTNVDLGLTQPPPCTFNQRMPLLP